MADIEQILGKRINTVKELRDEIKRLQDSIVTASEGTDEWVDASKKLNAAQTQLSSVTSAGKQSVDAAKDSIVGMEKEYKNLYNTYKLLSEEQRNSDFGKEMAASLDTLSEKLNTTKKNVGNFKDNIGHYADGAMEAFSQLGISVGGLAGPMKIASAASKGLGASLKALIANPVGAVIMAIVVAFKALGAIVDRVKEAIKGNEESQMALKEAMSAFQPVIDGVSNAFDALGKVVVSVIGWVGNAVNAIRGAFAAFTDFLGITDGASEKVKEQQELYKGLAKAENDLAKQRRETQKLNAVDEARVEQLREEAAEMENGAEKAKKLEEAKKIQAEIDERAIAIANEELRILQEKSKLTANDAATNDALAAAEAKVSQATANAARNQRRLQKELNASRKSTTGLTEDQKELQRVLQEINDKEKTDLDKLEEKYSKEKRLLEKYHKDTTKLTKQYLEERAKLEDEALMKRINAEDSAVQRTRQHNKNMTDLTIKSLQQDNLAYYAQLKMIENKKDEITNLENDLKKKQKEILELKTDDARTEMQDQINKISEDIIKEKQNLADLNGELVDIAVDNPFIKTNLDNFNKVIIGFKEALKNAGLEDELKRLDEALASDNPFRAIEEFFNSSDVEYYNVEKYGEAFKNLANSVKTYAELARRGGTTIKQDLNLMRELGSIGYVGYGKEVTFQLNSLEMLQQLEKELERDRLEEQKQYITEQLNNAELSAEKRAELEEQLSNIKLELWERELEASNAVSEAQMEANNKLKDSFFAVTDSIGSITQGFSALYKAQLEDENISDANAKKKKKRLENLAKLEKYTAEAAVYAETAGGIMSIWKGYTMEKITNAQTAMASGPAAAGVLAALNTKSLISAIAQIAGLGATAAGQIAAIKGNYISTMHSLNSSDSSVATPAAIDSTPYSYTRTLQTEEEEEMLNRPIWVSVTDINNAQNKVQVVEGESSF